VPGESPLVVLHVAEAAGAGTATSIRSMIRAVPEARHTVLYIPRRSHVSPPDELEDVTYIQKACNSHLAAIRAVGLEYRRINPHVVHLHSSLAGLYGRLGTTPTRKIVYTPHCFAFERTDLPPILSSLIRSAERVLSRRTGCYLAVSEREGHLAAGLGGRQIEVCGNAPGLPQSIAGSASPPRGNRPLRVVAMGRVGPQKAPDFFLRTVERARALGSSARFVWIGDGEPGMCAALESHGVVVTGWLPHEQALRELASADAYLHTAAWEGQPMTVLEAAAIGLPVILRRVPSTTGLRVGVSVDDEASAAVELLRLEDSGRWVAVSAQGLAYVGNHATIERLRAPLLRAYRLQAAATGGVRDVVPG
jgi:glycosyltransferase involved in cell wall biosynthesis